MTKMVHALFQVSSENGADPMWISVGAYGVAQNGRHARLSQKSMFTTFWITSAR